MESAGSKPRRAIDRRARHEIPRDDADVARLLVRLLAPLVAEELRRKPFDEWVDQATSPLGRRRHRELAKKGSFPAHKEGRRWLARRSDVDAYIQAHGNGGMTAAPSLAVPGALPANDGTQESDPGVEAALAEAGLELAPMPARSRKRRP